MSEMEQPSELDSCTTPVLTLPNEIISEIFLLSLPDYPRCPPLIGPLSPTSLTQICPIWREIALTTPALWRAIAFSTDAIIPFARRLEMFDLWLRRSRHCPLSVELVSFDDADLFEDDHYMSPNAAAAVSAVSAAVVHSARWEYLTIHVSAHISPTIFPTIGAAMPLLLRLDLNLGNTTDIVAFRDPPLLRTVILDLDYAFAFSLLLPLAQLTSLSLTNASPGACLPFLQQTPNLVHCELELYHGYGDQAIDIQLPLLESLTLTRSGNRPPPTWYLRTLAVPALRSLRVPESFLGPHPLETLRSFISKSGSKLQDVYILGSSIPESFYCRAFPWIHVRALPPRD
ncbi:hypothetical protein C8R47DRAFT_1316364 [Mycena vitilis]|nr:hypothetical protein C8R47DRAFT_1316364 [Mycena vitilis]